VRGLFDRHRYKTIATLRADGSPRISGIEVAFEDGELAFGSMPDARKGADLGRDPRFALHSATIDPVEGAEAQWPGEAKIREGFLHSRWPATFPSGQGSDLAGIVGQLGENVSGVAVGDEVIGWVDTPVQPGGIRRGRGGAPGAEARRGALGSGGRPPRRRLYRLGGRARSACSRGTRSSCRARPAGSARSPSSSPGGPAPP